VAAPEVDRVRRERGVGRLSQTPQSFQEINCIKMALKTLIPDECKACRTKIIFLLTEKNKLMPVDADTVESGDKYFNYRKHKSHFVTCTRPSVFRRKAKPDPREDERREAEQIKKELEEVKSRIENDKRPFILHNKFEVTVSRYRLLNICSKNGMSYDDLVNLSNREIYEWMSEREIKEDENMQLTLL